MGIYYQPSRANPYKDVILFKEENLFGGQKSSVCIRTVGLIILIIVESHSNLDLEYRQLFYGTFITVSHLSFLTKSIEQ